MRRCSLHSRVDWALQRGAIAEINNGSQVLKQLRVRHLHPSLSYQHKQSLYKILPVLGATPRIHCTRPSTCPAEISHGSVSSRMDNTKRSITKMSDTSGMPSLGRKRTDKTCSEQQGQEKSRSTRVPVLPGGNGTGDKIFSLSCVRSHSTAKARM